ncbi:RNA chaperone Hfq [bacterium]|nr:RNA chaperone Hfq [bacterium]
MIDFQQPYLSEIKKNKVKIKIVFSGGDSLSGLIIAFDNYSLLLRSEEKDYLVFKNNVNFIEPVKKFKFPND